MVNLQDVPKLKGYFSFTLRTNSTVYLSLEVWDKDLFSDNNDRIRDIDYLVIPFSVITASNVWTVKRFTLPDGAYLEIQFQIETCNGNFGGLGCSFCADHNKTGENCDICQKEWSGEKCEECAENFFPEKVCNLTCTAVKGRYSCSDSGEIVCNENWVGAACDICAEHRTGETCEKCSEGWGGSKCQECAQDYYPEIICNVKCTAVKGRYTCSNSGTKVCNEKWKGAECDNCADNTTGVGNNCKKFNNYRWVAIGTTTIAAVSIITTAGLIVYVVVLRRRLKENERNFVTRSNKIENTEMPEKERDNIQVEYACPDEYEDDETYADVTVLDNETVQMTRQKCKK